MSNLDFSRCRPVWISEERWSPTPEHVKESVREIVANPFIFLADEMGYMKTSQVIIAAQFLYEAGEIDDVLVVCPEKVRAVWLDRTFGEIARHTWEGVPIVVTDYHSSMKQWQEPEGAIKLPRQLRWRVTNYEYLRYKSGMTLVGKRRQFTLGPYAKALLPYLNRRSMIVCDESAAISSMKSLTYKTLKALRDRCGRAIVMNGTPVGEAPDDLLGQCNFLSPSILDCPSETQFKTRYATLVPVLGAGGKQLTSPRGFGIVKVKDWHGLDEINARVKPYMVRRTEGVQLPHAFPPVALTVPFSAANWKRYVEMRDELVVWLTSRTVVTAPQIVVKLMRLAQMTSGFIGGVVDMELDDREMTFEEFATVAHDPADTQHEQHVREIGREKLDYFLEWHAEQLKAEPDMKLVVFARFRPEILRLVAELQGRVTTGMLIGGQKKSEQEVALRLLDPRSAPEGPVVVVSSSAGARGLNMTAAATIFRPSNDWSLQVRQQADKRIDRPGQTRPTRYFDLLATGPRGQRTVDFDILERVAAKGATVEETAAGWARRLKVE